MRGVTDGGFRHGEGGRGNGVRRLGWEGKSRGRGGDREAEMMGA